MQRDWESLKCLLTLKTEKNFSEEIPLPANFPSCLIDQNWVTCPFLNQSQQDQSRLCLDQSGPPGAGAGQPPLDHSLYVCVCMRVYAHGHTCVHTCEYSSGQESTRTPLRWLSAALDRRVDFMVNGDEPVLIPNARPWENAAPPTEVQNPKAN